MKKKTVMLAILDGFGISEKAEGNAIKTAKTPHLDYFFENYPHAVIQASGMNVGLPSGQMGNSEVGHTNMGAGRVVYQDYVKINMAVADNTLIENEAIKAAVDAARKNKGKLHIFGLASPGGVHAHLDHILYLIRAAAAKGVETIVAHPFLDGRDVLPASAEPFLAKIEAALAECPNGKMGMVSGRYYVMDRDRNWDRIQPAYDALVYGRAEHKPWRTGLAESYEKGVTDEFVYPFLVDSGTEIAEGDAVIFANFRQDRAIQISLALTNWDKTKVVNPKHFQNLTYTCMAMYSADVQGLVAFPPEDLKNIYGEVISNAGMTQLRIAETEKYAHVTYFFDGAYNIVYPGEERILVPSPKEVPTYDLKPEMSAYEITEQVVPAIESGRFDTIVLNFANCDMVGHTTFFDATVKAVEAVDECLGKIYDAIKKVDGTLLITADHGNAEQLLDEAGNPFSAHTTNPVPLILIKSDADNYALSGGCLADIAPTLLAFLGLKQPAEMTGKCLVKKIK